MKGLAQGDSAGQAEQGRQPGLTEHRSSTGLSAGGSAGARSPGGEKGWEGFGLDGWLVPPGNARPRPARPLPTGLT